MSLEDIVLAYMAAARPGRDRASPVNYLIWRLHRTQAYISGAALAALTVLLLITGTSMAHDYQAFLRLRRDAQLQQHGPHFRRLRHPHRPDVCHGRHPPAVRDVLGRAAAGQRVRVRHPQPRLDPGRHPPPLAGPPRHVGPPRRHHRGCRHRGPCHLVAQPRKCARHPLQPVGSRPVRSRGNPAAYAIFAAALGIAAGAMFRRVLPAIATTLAIFIAVRVAILYLRPHYMTPVTKLVSFVQGPPPGAWIFTKDTIGPGSQSTALSATRQ